MKQASLLRLFSSSQSIVASTQYNAAGQVLQQNAPYFHPAALGGYRTPDWNLPKTVTTYDAYGRAKQVTNPDSSKTCTYYQGLQTAVVYEQTAGATYTYFQKISATDQLGRLSSVKDYMGTVGNNPGATCPAPAWTANPNGTTSYQYDVADRLVKTTGPDGAQIEITYDALGRKTWMKDPNMGIWTYAYDQVSNLTRQTDARGQTVCFYYDGLSRLLGKHTRTDLDCPAWTSNPSLAAQYTYDAGSNGIGRRTGMTDGSGSASWLYDTRGRVTRETKVVSGTGGGTFVTNWTAYDAMDRVRTMQYPDGETVTLSYTSQGLLKGVSGTSVYVGDTLYNALGQVTDRYLGSATGQVRQKYTYTQAENFRLTALQSGTSASGYTNLQNVTYTYDDQGNVLTVVDAAAFGGSQTQTFTYDALNRLLTAQASGGSNGVYTVRSYNYTNAGNIDSFEGAALGYNDAAHKHAVTHIAGAQRYWYDQNGNATRRVNGTQDITLAYDTENHVTSITGSGINATSVYDGDGKRVKATVGGVTTVYIGNYYERDNGTTVRKYYYAGAVRVAMRTGGNTFYLLNDHLTSTAITTNSSGVRLTELRYFAYGGTRYDAGGQMTLYRYTGQRIETGTGLYDYGARWYDPLIGRFLAADSIVPNPGDSQALNRYMYVAGNPIKYSDPTGHCPWCISVGIGGAIGAVAGLGLYTVNILSSGQEWNMTEALTVAGTGAVAGALIGSGIGAPEGISMMAATVVAVGTSGGVGLAAGGAGYLATNTATGSAYNNTEFAIAAGTSGATMAIGQAAAAGVVGASVLGAAANLTQYEATRLVRGQGLALDSGALWAAGTGAVGGAIGGGYSSVGQMTNSGSVPVITNVRYGSTANRVIQATLSDALERKLPSNLARSAVSSVVTSSRSPVTTSRPAQRRVALAME